MRPLVNMRWPVPSARATASRALDTSGITAPPPARIRLFRLNLHTLFTPFERHDRNET
jgi:hypothetical protein